MSLKTMGWLFGAILALAAAVFKSIFKGRSKMIKNKVFFISFIFGLMLASAAFSPQVKASVLIQGWTGSGESGFGDAFPKHDDNVFGGIAVSAEGNAFNVDGTSHTEMFINTNGMVSFGEAVGNLSSGPFPRFGFGGDDECGGECLAPQSISDCEIDCSEPPPLQPTGVPIFAPFWADINVREGGDLHLGSPNEDTLVVTWNEVAQYGGDAGENTFQLVLIDRDDTGEGNFDVEFRYDNLEWSRNAQAGIDVGNAVNFFNLPGANSSAVSDLDTVNSNTDTAGIWKFAFRGGLMSDGSSAETPLLPIIDPDNSGDYSFEFEVEEAEPFFIDPEVAIGYDYIVDNGPSITSVLLPMGFDDNLFALWLWDGSDWIDANTQLIGGQWFNFVDAGFGALEQFRIMGIDTTNMVDPANPIAFITGLTFDESGTVNMRQVAITEFVDDPNDIPEPPVTLLMALAGFGLLIRKRKA